MHFMVYLDEFGHDGPYVARSHPQHNSSPLFGLAGMALPVNRVRAFAGFFYGLKTNLLAWEIKRAGQHPARWEKKGASLFTTRNVVAYPELRRATIRVMNRIRRDGGFVIFHGLEKYRPPAEHDARKLYQVTLGKAMRLIDAEVRRRGGESAVIVLDEHQERVALLEYAARTMFGSEPPLSIIEPPMQVESHLYQTVQCADWICGLVGRLGCYWLRPDEFADFSWADTYFSPALRAASCPASRIVPRRTRVEVLPG